MVQSKTNKQKRNHLYICYNKSFQKLEPSKMWHFLFQNYSNSESIFKIVAIFLLIDLVSLWNCCISTIMAERNRSFCFVFFRKDILAALLGSNSSKSLSTTQTWPEVGRSNEMLWYIRHVRVTGAKLRKTVCVEIQRLTDNHICQAEISETCIKLDQNFNGNRSVGFVFTKWKTV